MADATPPLFHPCPTPAGSMKKVPTEGYLSPKAVINPGGKGGLGLMVRR